MRTMKDSGIEWIGDIPADWKTIKSKYCISISNGTDPKTVGSTPVYGSGAESFKTCGEYKIGPAVLLGRKGATLHIPHYIEGNYWNVDTAFDAIAFCGNINLKFYYYCACVFDYAGYISQTTLPGMTKTNYNNMSIPFPPIEIQKRIANFLDEKCKLIDGIIAHQQEVIEKLKAYKLSVITEAVTKGLNPDVPTKDNGVEWIGEIPDFWNVVPLKTCSDILPGYAFSSDDFDTKNGTALLRGINVTPNGIRWEDVVYWNKPITKQLQVFELVAGDIVVGLDRPWVSGGTRVCWVTQKDLPALLLQRVCRIRAKENIDNRWIYHWIASKSFQEALSIETTGVSVPHISTKQIEQFSITLPPIEVQHQICDILEATCGSIDNVVNKKQGIIDKLTEYKKSLIYEVVTGKKEV